MLDVDSRRNGLSLHISTRQDLGSRNIYPAVERHTASVLQILQ
jgi:hypothetical protein